MVESNLPQAKPPKNQMVLEVEQKFRVDDLEVFRRSLDAIGCQIVKQLHEWDTYFAHPVRNFATTDEAFRLRTSDGRHQLTYKGPRNPGPVKTRREIEVPVGSLETERQTIVDMILALGFQVVADVNKSRQMFSVSDSLSDAGEEPITVTIDQVVGLSPHVEIELIAQHADAASLRIRGMAAKLGLDDEQIEHRSYLEMCLDRETAAKSS